MQRQLTSQKQPNIRSCFTTQTKKIKRLEEKVICLTTKLEAANLLTAEAKAALKPYEGIELAVAVELG